MLRIITVIPEEGNFSFSVKYCDQKVSIPGFGCSLSETAQLILPLVSMGCAGWQISIILDMIKGNEEGVVLKDEDGDVDYCPDEDGDNEWD